jgi:hypothetical protein
MLSRDGLMLTPFYPPLKQEYFLFSHYLLFKRGREFERGRSPLSPVLPSPARNIFILLNETGWRGARGKV